MLRPSPDLNESRRRPLHASAQVVCDVTHGLVVINNNTYLYAA